jgi:carboxyl-terminal processing protease
MKKNITLIVLLIITVFSASSADKSTEATFRINKNLSVFNAVIRELDLNYVDTLNYDKVIKNAVDGMLSKLDPYTVYMPEDETDDLKFMTTGEYGGIGALIMKTNDGVCVSEPYEGMPAQKNDVRAGDVILTIDGQDVSKLSVNEVSNLLKGTPNTVIKLKIKRIGEKNPIEKSFLREKIQINPIHYSACINEKTGYILIGEFTDKTAQEFKTAVNEMVKSQKIENLIIDLRNNGGGLVDEAVKIAGYFVPKGTEIVRTKGKKEEETKAYSTTFEPVFGNMNIVVLVNRGTASASEILCGALQDLDRAVIVGERTFGKGLVQSVRSVGYGGHLKVTTAKYYIPSGRCIQAIDYSHRNEDGSVGRVPDSLTSIYKTMHGRLVRDGGGIVPDTLTVDDKKLNISYYIFAQNLYFEYANIYCSKHGSIPKPSEFQLSDEDFNDFKNFLKAKNFKYNLQTEKYYDDLLEVAGYEGLDKEAKAEFDALRLKLKPDIDKNLELNKSDVVEVLSLELIKRYYFQKGEIEFSLRQDDDLNVAVNILNNKEFIAKILKL